MRVTRLGEPSRPRLASTSTRSGRRLERWARTSVAEEQRPTTWWASPRENNASRASLNSGCESASSTRAIAIPVVRASSPRAFGCLLWPIPPSPPYSKRRKLHYDSRRPSPNPEGPFPAHSGHSRRFPPPTGRDKAGADHAAVPSLVSSSDGHVVPLRSTLAAPQVATGGLLQWLQ